MHGIINIYKPSGMSSNFVLTILKKNLNLKKLGHLGTLDPLACGVLPVMVNKGTKLFTYYLNKTKTYRAIFTFTKETTTLDSEGEIIKTINKIPSVDELNNAVKKLTGKISQIPPIFSAKKVNGKNAYELARKGESVELKPKLVEIYDFKLIKQINETSFLFEIKCSSGTYIRSIARDMGNLVSSCAFMSALIRMDSGEFNILKSTYVKDLTKVNFADKLIKLKDLLKTKEKIVLDKTYFKKLSNGVKVNIDYPDYNDLIVFCEDQLIGLGSVKANLLTINTNLQN